MSVRIVVLAIAVGGLAAACFDGPDEIEGLKCTDNTQCPKGLQCVPLGIDEDFDGVNDSECQEPAATTATTVSTTVTSASTTVGDCVSNFSSCVNGETCCTGTCRDDGQGVGTLICLDDCASQTDCVNGGCCAFRNDIGAMVCTPC